MRRRRLLAVLLAFGGGLVVATQARINGEFGEVVGSATAAATLSVVTGLVVLTPIVFAITPLRTAVAAVPATELPEVPPPDKSPSWFDELLEMDWVAIILGLIALIAVGGLIPFWIWVYFVYNPPSP